MTEQRQHDIARHLDAVRQSIASSREGEAHASHTITLLAVSKKKPVSDIRAAFLAGQHGFGENYVDEAIEKIRATEDIDIEWHFIGSIQSRKTRAIAEHFAWAQSVDRLKVAERLSAQRPEHLPPLSVCIQVNPDGELSKGGVAPGAELDELADACATLPGLKLRGLMAIPAPRHDVTEQRAVFRQIRELYLALKTRHPQLDTLSMGMSGDLDAAIAEGANLVRVGTAIFGQRET